MSVVYLAIGKDKEPLAYSTANKAMKMIDKNVGYTNMRVLEVV